MTSISSAMTTDDLRRLRGDTNAILAKLQSNRPNSLDYEPVNWADLSCVRVMLCFTQAGECMLIIEIEEADSRIIEKIVRDALSEAGWPGDNADVLDVRTEW